MRLVTPLLLLLGSLGALAQPAITNIRVAQRPGTNLVDLDYDLSGATGPVRISMEFSSDSGTTFSPATSVTGAAGDSIQAASNLRITWDAGKDWGGKVSNNMRYRILADDNPPPKGMVRIPAGAFQMGDALDGISDAPVHTVTLSEYFIGQKEVSKAEWDEVRTWALANGYTDLSAASGKAANHPAQTISWRSVVKWCNARSEKEGLTPCYTISGAVMRTGTTAPECNWTANGYRLPTEAEWEKAARGGLVGKRFPWGDSIAHDQANYNSTAVYSYNVSPTIGSHPVYGTGSGPYSSTCGFFAPNGYGIHDIAGNVWEWCWDWYGAYPLEAQSDPKGAATGTARVLRGGSWSDTAAHSRVGFRVNVTPSNISYNLGFRTARSSVP
jgi:formylglycine-generating enzyme required for sulfatase activity